MYNFKNSMLKYTLKFKELILAYAFIAFLYVKLFFNPICDNPITALIFLLSSLASVIIYLYLSINYFYYTDDDFNYNNKKITDNNE